MDLADIEQLKLIASAMDRFSTAMLTVGAIAPLAAAAYARFSSDVVLTIDRKSALVGLTVFWTISGLFIHFTARRVLKGLRG